MRPERLIACHGRAGRHRRTLIVVNDHGLCFTGAAHRRYRQGTVAVPRRFARLLGLPPGEVMVERVITLIVDGEPLLASTSYLPPELADDADDAEGWQQVEIGQLALPGHAVRSTFVEEWTRTGTSTERTVPAGTIVLARTDRVRLRWDWTS
jgi:chorismate-pyruvate lyase